MHLQSHDALVQLYHQIKYPESWLLPPGVLQQLGIQASQVDTAKDELLLFNPCFFRPHPEDLPRRHQFSAPIDDYQHNCELNPPPNLDAIVRQAQNVFPNNGEYLHYANSQYMWALADWASREREPKERARALFNYINHPLIHTPLDQEWPFTLRGPCDCEIWE